MGPPNGDAGWPSLLAGVTMKIGIQTAPVKPLHDWLSLAIRSCSHIVGHVSLSR